MTFELLTAAVGVIGGAIASISGFGIGSTLTPLLTFHVGAKLAVAATALPHLAGTVLRFWRLRAYVDRHVFWTFGLMNAAGGLLGALIHAYVQSTAVRVVFGIVLMFTGLMGLTGWIEKMKFRGTIAWMAGIISGGLGGFAGTQGGLRAAAMFGFDLSKTAFVATATAIGILVDLARTPVYLAAEGQALLAIWPLILASLVGVLVGTLIGERLLRRIPEHIFRKVVSALILLLGASMLVAFDQTRASATGAFDNLLADESRWNLTCNSLHVGLSAKSVVRDN